MNGRLHITARTGSRRKSNLRQSARSALWSNTRAVSPSAAFVLSMSLVSSLSVAVASMARSWASLPFASTADMAINGVLQEANTRWREKASSDHGFWVRALPPLFQSYLCPYIGTTGIVQLERGLKFWRTNRGDKEGDYLKRSAWGLGCPILPLHWAREALCIVIGLRILAVLRHLTANPVVIPRRDRRFCHRSTLVDVFPRNPIRECGVRHSLVWNSQFRAVGLPEPPRALTARQSH